MIYMQFTTFLSLFNACITTIYQNNAQNVAETRDFRAAKIFS